MKRPTILAFTTVALIAALSSGNTQANTITAFSNQSGLTTLQGYTGSLGLDFTVNAPILITALGAFDDGNVQNLTGASGTGVAVAIFNVATGTQVGSSVLFTPSTAGTQVGGDAFMNVTPFYLGTGTYSVVSANDMNYNTSGFGEVPNTTTSLDSGGGLISFTGGGRYSVDGSATLTFPTHIDYGPANRYDAGTFQFTAAVPEPESMMLLAVGAIGLGVARRRCR